MLFLLRASAALLFPSRFRRRRIHARELSLRTFILASALTDRAARPAHLAASARAQLFAQPGNVYLRLGRRGRRQAGTSFFRLFLAARRLLGVSRHRRHASPERVGVRVRVPIGRFLYQSVDLSFDFIGAVEILSLDGLLFQCLEPSNTLAIFL